jgi:CRP/FNR family transcriptional regulator, cyclic AMP receptor protein
MDKINSLRKTELFGSLSDDALAPLADCALRRRLRAGEILFSEHSEASALSVVVAGRFRSIRRDSNGREQVLSTEGPGALLGIAPLFDGGPYFSTMLAQSRSEVLSIQKSDLHAFCREHPEVFWSVARVLGRNLREYAELIQALALLNVEQRLAQFLLHLCERTLSSNGRGTTLELTITQADLAARVGSSREVVNRGLHRLQERGLIQLKGIRLLFIPNTDALRTFAGMQNHVGPASQEFAASAGRDCAGPEIPSGA